jgi:hypothetical protein
LLLGHRSVLWPNSSCKPQINNPSAQLLRHVNEMAGLLHGGISRQGRSATLLVTQASIESRQFRAQIYNPEIHNEPACGTDMIFGSRHQE